MSGATARNIGRVIGVLLLAQMAGGFVLNMVLLQPVFSAPGGYLANAAPHALSMSLAALLNVVTGALSAVIAVVALPVFRRHSETMAFGFLSLAVAAFTLAAVESTALMSLLTLSQTYANAPAVEASQFEVIRGAVAWARNWAHYIHLIIAGCMNLLLYGVLVRFVLVPLVLGVLGMLAAVSQITAVTLPLFGHPVMFAMIYPLGITHLLLVLWLLTKGFADRPAPTRPD